MKIQGPSRSKPSFLIGFLVLFFFVFVVGPCIGYAVFSYGDAPLYVVNGFDEPVEIVIDGDEVVRVEPYQMESFSLGSGELSLESRFVDGDRIETVTAELPGFSQRIFNKSAGTLYNIAGVGTPYLETVVYYDEAEFEYVDGELVHTGKIDSREGIEPLVGHQVVVLEDVHRVDEEFPEYVFFRGTARTGLYYEGANLSNSLWQVGWMLDLENLQLALSNLSEFAPDTPGLFYLLSHIPEWLEEHQQEEWLAGLAQISANHPDNLVLNIAYLRTMKSSGAGAAVADHFAKLHETKDARATAFYLAILEEDDHRRHKLLERAAELETQDAFFHEEMVFQWSRLGACSRIDVHVRALAQRWRDGEIDGVFHDIPYARCLLAIADDDALEGLDRLMGLLGRKAYEGVYLDYSLVTLPARIVASLDDEFPPRASAMDERALAVLGADSYYGAELYLVTDAGFFLDSEYEMLREESTLEERGYLVEFNRALYQGLATDLIQHFDVAIDKSDEVGIPYFLEPELLTLIAVLGLAVERYDVFEMIYDRGREELYYENLNSAAQHYAHFLASLDDGVGPRAFDAELSNYWDQEYRVAYLIGRAVAAEDEETRRESLEEAVAADPLWSPVKAFARAKLEAQTD